MLKSGNGQPKKCIENLLSIVRGEIPFDRVRGLDARLIDSPSETAKAEFEQDARWNVKTYEPRINVDTVKFDVKKAKSGDFTVDVDISDVEATDD